MAENEEFDLKAEYAKAKDLVAKTEMDGSEDAISIYLDVLYGDVLMAEENLKWEDDRSYENAALVRELLHYGRILSHYKQTVSELFKVASRIEDSLNNHPRLKLELMKFEKELLPDLNAEEAEIDIEEESDRLDESIAMYERNIAFADKGEYDKIEDNTRTLAYDPIEWSAQMEEIIDDVERELSLILKDEPRRMGFCFGYWSEKRSLLEKKYGIEWRDPNWMNPGVIFD